jgi:hypothetical protein
MAKPVHAHAHPLEPTSDLSQIFAVCERIDQMLLAGVDEQAWRSVPPTGKGRTIAELFAHIHNVRLMWLESAAKEAPRPAKIS